MGNLESWIQGLKATLDLVLKQPASLLEWWALLMAAVLACAMVLRFTALAFGMGRTGFGISGFISLVGLALILLSLTAVRMWLPLAGLWILAAATFLISLILVLPLICFFLKSHYFAAFFAWWISLGAAVGAVALLSAGFNAVSTGVQEAGKAKAHKQDLEVILGNSPSPHAPGKPAR